MDIGHCFLSPQRVHQNEFSFLFSFLSVFRKYSRILSAPHFFPLIITFPMDTDKQLRLQKNREASRRFRKRQREEHASLQEQVERLRAENAENESRIAYLEAEKVFVNALLTHFRSEVEAQVQRPKTPSSRNEQAQEAY